MKSSDSSELAGGSGGRRLHLFSAGGQEILLGVLEGSYVPGSTPGAPRERTPPDLCPPSDQRAHQRAPACPEHPKTC